jgi:hypothetical protein
MRSDTSARVAAGSPEVERRLNTCPDKPGQPRERAQASASSFTRPHPVRVSDRALAGDARIARPRGTQSVDDLTRAACNGVMRSRRKGSVAWADPFRPSSAPRHGGPLKGGAGLERARERSGRLIRAIQLARRIVTAIVGTRARAVVRPLGVVRRRRRVGALAARAHNAANEPGRRARPTHTLRAYAPAMPVCANTNRKLPRRKGSPRRGRRSWIHVLLGLTAARTRAAPRAYAKARANPSARPR